MPALKPRLAEWLRKGKPYLDKTKDFLRWHNVRTLPGKLLQRMKRKKPVSERKPEEIKAKKPVSEKTLKELLNEFPQLKARLSQPIEQLKECLKQGKPHREKFAAVQRIVGEENVPQEVRAGILGRLEEFVVGMEAKHPQFRERFKKSVVQRTSRQEFNRFAKELSERKHLHPEARKKALARVETILLGEELRHPPTQAKMLQAVRQGKEAPAYLKLSRTLKKRTHLPKASREQALSRIRKGLRKARYFIPKKEQRKGVIEDLDLLKGLLEYALRHREAEYANPQRVARAIEEWQAKGKEYQQELNEELAGTRKTGREEFSLEELERIRKNELAVGKKLGMNKLGRLTEEEKRANRISNLTNWITTSKASVRLLTEHLNRLNARQERDKAREERKGKKEEEIKAAIDRRKADWEKKKAAVEAEKRKEAAAKPESKPREEKRTRKGEPGSGAKIIQFPKDRLAQGVIEEEIHAREESLELTQEEARFDEVRSLQKSLEENQLPYNRIGFINKQIQRCEGTIRSFEEIAKKERLMGRKPSNEALRQIGINKGQLKLYKRHLVRLKGEEPVKAQAKKEKEREKTVGWRNVRLSEEERRDPEVRKMIIWLEEGMQFSSVRLTERPLEQLKAGLRNLSSAFGRIGKTDEEIAGEEMSLKTRIELLEAHLRELEAERQREEKKKKKGFWNKLFG